MFEDFTALQIVLILAAGGVLQTAIVGLYKWGARIWRDRHDTRASSENAPLSFVEVVREFENWMSSKLIDLPEILKLVVMPFLFLGAFALFVGPLFLVYALFVLFMEMLKSWIS